MMKSLSPKNRTNGKGQKMMMSKIVTQNQFTPVKMTDSVVSPYSNSIVTGSSSSRLLSKLKSLSPRNTFGLSVKKKLKKIKRQLSPVSKMTNIAQLSPGEHLLPLPYNKAISIFSTVLSKFELCEMAEYDEIYYIGLKANKIVPDANLKNYGFDDIHTQYAIVPGDHIRYQYEILEVLGAGSFAQVIKCWDHKSQKEVAIKIIKSHKKFTKPSETEVKVLSYLKKEAEKRSSFNFVNILACFQFRKHLCLVFELLSFTLYDLLKANSFKGFSSGLIRRFCIQLLQALSILKQSKIIHCDLKPENVALINPYESAIKLIDFGSSCFENEKIYYYIQSRIYRAPEVILGVPYTCAIDMWSLGCILVELSIGTPLFISENEEDQLNAIMEVLGNPPVSLVDNGLKSKKFLGPRGKIKNAATPTGKVRVPESRRLEEILAGKDVLFVEFIKSKI